MSEVESATTELKTQYAAQVAADLERNIKEQERIGSQVVALQEQLDALRHDHALLVNLRGTLGGESTAQAGPGAEGGDTVAPSEDSDTPAPSLPRQASAETKPGKGKKAAATKPRKTAAKSPETKASAPAARQPTLVELIRNHVAQQSEPRSAAEITASLTQAHPDRDIKPKVVRTTVEGLVAKGHVHRAKQGSSVFYTTAETPSTEIQSTEAPSTNTSPEQDPVTV